MHQVLQKVSGTRQTSHGSLLQRVAEQICFLLEHHESAGLIGAVLVISACSVFISIHKFYWFDEVFAMMIASQPDIHSMLRAMPPDQNPPLTHLLLRAMIHLFGPTNLAGRIPSILAFVAAGLGVYLYVRRRCGVPVAFLALGLLMGERGWAYSLEARPYALVLAFTMLTLVSWQQAAGTEFPRIWPLLGMVLGIAGAMFTQHLGLVAVGFPVLCGETWRLRRTHSIDWPIAGTFLIAVPILAITLPMARRSREAMAYLHPDNLPGLTPTTLLHWTSMVRASLSEIIGLSALLLAVPISIAICRKWRNAPVLGVLDAPSIPAHEIAAAIGAALLIPVTALVLLPINNRYDCRYAIGTIAGLSVLMAFSMAALVPNRKDILSVLLLVCIVLFADNVRHSYAIIRPVTFPSFAGSNPNLPVVTTEAFTFYPLWWYSTPVQRNRLHLVYDPLLPPGLKAMAVFEQDKFPMHVDTYNGFLNGQSRFFELSSVPEFTQLIQASGFQITPVGSASAAAFEAKRTPFRAPGTAP